MFQYYSNSYDLWPFRHKVTFDGTAKRIRINYEVATLDVKSDLYSAWKEWSSLRENLAYQQAFRTIGGDPINVQKGIYAGDIYFLMNGWQIIIDHAVEISGVIYHNDNGLSPFIITAGAGVRSTVSNLTQTVQTSGGNSSAPTVQQIRTELSPELGHVMTLSSVPPPSPQSIAQAVRTELSSELSRINAQINGLTQPQATMLLEMYRLMGLDPTKPLVVTSSTVNAGPEIHQSVTGDQNSTTVTRI